LDEDLDIKEKKIIRTRLQLIADKEDAAEEIKLGDLKKDSPIMDVIKIKPEQLTKESVQKIPSEAFLYLSLDQLENVSFKDLNKDQCDIFFNVDDEEFQVRLNKMFDKSAVSLLNELPESHYYRVDMFDFFQIASMDDQELSSLILTK